MAAIGENGPLVPHRRPCAPCQHVELMDDNPPSKRLLYWGLLRVCMALKTLQCCGDSSLPEQRSALRAIHTLNCPQNTSAGLGGCYPSIWSLGAEHKASCGALGGHYCWRRPWLWWLWCQLCFVLRLLKNAIETLKLVVCKQWFYLLLYVIKHIVIHTSLIVAWPEPAL